MRLLDRLERKFSGPVAFLVRPTPFLRPGFVIACWCLFWAQSSSACDGPSAHLVSLQGHVEIHSQANAQWQSARLQQPLCKGDTVAVRANSRAALALPNQVVLRLDQGSVLTLGSLASDETSEMNLLQGALHVLTRFNKRFGVKTPFMNAMVDGTEFVVTVADQSATVAVQEGHVRAENSQGYLLLTPGQSAVATTAQPLAFLEVRPRDALRWTIYFPQVVQLRLSEIFALPQPAQQALRAAARLAQQGQFTQALAQWPSSVTESDHLRALRASWLLALGQVETAERLLANDSTRLPASLHGAEADLWAVQALADLILRPDIHSHTETLLAATAEPSTALALSYLRQARRDPTAALHAARQATQLAPDNPLAWARQAELELSLALIQDGQRSAQTAVALDASPARAQALLGFAALLQGRLQVAAEQLSTAQTLDSGDPLAALGLGLTALRQGHLAQARQSIETAVMLDPTSADLRSLLARLYLRENRISQARSELQLATTLDNNNPGVWLDTAVMNHQEGLRLQAAQNLQQAIALGPQRGVFRSNRLLQADRADQLASLAGIWGEIGFDANLENLAREALQSDFQSPQAHQMLGQAYANLGQYETARVSEMLQAQLRQPPGSEPVAPQELQPFLPMLKSPRFLSLQETRPFLDQSALNARLGLWGGNHGLAGGTLLAWTSWGEEHPSQLSFGHFRYNTDGFRPEAKVDLNLNQWLLKTTLHPSLTAQLEARQARQKGGDITQKLVPENASPEKFRQYETDSLRLGLRYQYEPQAEWLFSWIHRRSSAFTRDITEFLDPPFLITAQDSRQQKGQSHLWEVLHSYQKDKMQWQAGLSMYQEKADIQTQISLKSTPPLPLPAIADAFNQSKTKHWTGHFQGQYALEKQVQLHAGLRYDDLKLTGLDMRQWSPSWGISWLASPSWTFGISQTKGTKGEQSKEQSIEPTLFAGFNQVFDDPVATRYQLNAFSVQYSPSPSFQGGLEVSEREVRLQALANNTATNCATATFCELKAKEHRLRLYGHQVFQHVALSIQAQYEKQRFEVATLLNGPSELRTWQIPVKAYIDLGIGWGFYTQYRWVDQQASFTFGPTPVANARFGLLDMGAQMRWSPQRVILALDVFNLLNRQFNYQDTYLSGSPKVPLFQPGRVVMFRAEMAF
jgi:Tfp pilus assembly protein PilF